MTAALGEATVGRQEARKALEGCCLHREELKGPQYGGEINAGEEEPILAWRKDRCESSQHIHNPQGQKPASQLQTFHNTSSSPWMQAGCELLEPRKGSRPGHL